jgi:hypothetical protein
MPRAIPPTAPISKEANEYSPVWFVVSDDQPLEVTGCVFLLKPE